jgi:serine/threonine protein kinase
MPFLIENSASSSSLRQLHWLKDAASQEMENCLRSRRPCRVEDLLERYPQLSLHPPLVLELIDLEYHLLLEIGQSPSVDDYCNRFPQWRDSLRVRLPAGEDKKRSDFNQAPTVAEADRPGRPSKPSPHQAGRHTLGPYELFERIGRGAMGNVYRARQGPPLNRIVALKMLRSDDDFEIQTFEKEIEVARRLRHPNLLPIYDAGQSEGEYYYTMPLALGGSLEKRLRQKRPDPRWTAEVMEKVARAVHYAHQQNVLHRDLKPANILLDERDEPLVADFGLAKLLDLTLGHTRSGQMLGSVPYMSPEQARGQSANVTPAADVWALGVILYEMLTGRRPFQGDNQSEVLTRIQKFEPFRPSQLEVDVPPDLEAICLRCLEKDLAWRYDSAEELADDLASWRNGQPLKKPQGEWFRNLIRSMKNLVTPRAGAGVLGCMILMSSLGLMVLPSASTISPDTAILVEEAHSSFTHPLVLFPRKDGLPWSKNIVGTDPRKKSTDRSQNLKLETFALSVLEILPPNPRRKAGRLVIEMRQCDGDELSLVGAYVGRRRNAHPLGAFHSMIEATYDDMMEPNDFHLTLEARCVTDRREMTSVPHRAQMPLRLAMRAVDPRDDNSYWRTLICDFGSEGMVVSIQDGIKEQYSANDLDAAFTRIQRRNRDLAGTHLMYDPSGGIGIYIYKASLEVRRIEFIPLASSND